MLSSLSFASLLSPIYFLLFSLLFPLHLLLPHSPTLSLLILFSFAPFSSTALPLYFYLLPPSFAFLLPLFPLSSFITSHLFTCCSHFLQSCSSPSIFSLIPSLSLPPDQNFFYLLYCLPLLICPVFSPTSLSLILCLPTVPETT